MKKLVLTIAVAAALVGGMASCSKKADCDGSCAATLTSKIQNCTNPDSLAVYVDQAKAYAQKLVDEGKVEEAKEYLAKIEPVVKEKAPALVGALSAAEGVLDKVSSSASDKLEDAKESAGEAVDNLGDAAEKAGDAAAQKAEDLKDAAAKKVDEAKDATAKKAQEVKDAAAKKVEEAKDATADAAQKSADKVKDLLK